MSYGTDRPDSWTNCSQGDFEDWYRRTGHGCLVEKFEEEVSCGDTRRVSGCRECVGEGEEAAGATLCRGDCRWHQGGCLSAGKSVKLTMFFVMFQHSKAKTHHAINNNLSPSHPGALLHGGGGRVPG